MLTKQVVIIVSCCEYIAPGRRTPVKHKCRIKKPPEGGFLTMQTNPGIPTLSRRRYQYSILFSANRLPVRTMVIHRSVSGKPLRPAIHFTVHQRLSVPSLENMAQVYGFTSVFKRGINLGRGSVRFRSNMKSNDRTAGSFPYRTSREPSCRLHHAGDFLRVAQCRCICSSNFANKSLSFGNPCLYTTDGERILLFDTYFNHKPSPCRRRYPDYP